MRKILTSALLMFCLFALTSPASAMDIARGLRGQADSSYRIAKKAYRKAVKDYGESLQGMPETERASACKKMGYGIYDNRTQIPLESSYFYETQYRRQLKELEGYAKTLGCPNQ
ncbi:hypothetical protein GM415_12835 [Pseudodesulfovibrio cashew]|uniref:Uncharacterized protein n=1 Tax=Pseudodesulfovibrio cashew TaxID=2678688 RepID=A0A6I6JTI7_9BACT|nr:hypothetical protein [Pseudodesulfovibrio cashew]QGY40974.1 hypothetical protein GM415_12835 [Pseudodesulfovibrio cashew]